MPSDLPETEVTKLRKLEAADEANASTVTSTWLIDMVAARKINEVKITPIGNDYETGLLEQIRRLPKVMSITTKHGQVKHKVRPVMIGCSGWMNLSILLHSLPSLDGPTPVLFITDINPNVIQFWQQMIRAAQETRDYHVFFDRLHEQLTLERLDDQIDNYDKFELKMHFRRAVLHHQRGLSPGGAITSPDDLFKVLREVLSKQTFIMPADMLATNCWKHLNEMIKFIKRQDLLRHIIPLVTLYTSNVYAITGCQEQVLANMESVDADVYCVTDFKIDRARHSIVAKSGPKYNAVKTVQKRINKLQAPTKPSAGGPGPRGIE